MHQPSTMQNVQDINIVGESSILKPFGQGYFYRVLDTLRPGRNLETEVEVLELGSGTFFQLHLDIVWSITISSR